MNESRISSQPYRSPDAKYRRAVLRGLRDMKRILGIATSSWDVRSTIYADRTERYRGPNEYPEMSADAWTKLAREMRVVEKFAAALAKAAEDNARGIRGI